MKKFLIGFPICMLIFILVVLPCIIFGEVGLLAVQLIVIIFGVTVISYGIGMIILEELESRR